MTNRTAATRYARALFDVVLAERQIDPQIVEQQLAEFVALFDAHPALAKVMVNPAGPVPRKAAVMTDLLARVTVTPALGKLLVLLAGRDRLVLLADMLAAYRDRLLVHQNVVRAEITTVDALSADTAKAIENGLAKFTGRTVQLSTRTDASIIGGVVARIGSTVYDGSVTRRLEKMKQALIEG